MKQTFDRVVDSGSYRARGPVGGRETIQGRCECAIYSLSLSVKRGGDKRFE
jgi:hypothetical protein